jgi:cyclic pyranopterin phosphate synthase
MVDVGAKPDTQRSAIARGHVSMKAETLVLIEAGTTTKGDVLTIAQIAGIMAAKRTSDLIPLCHPLPVTHIDVTLTINKTHSRIEIEASVSTTGKTGVEMEALTAVSIAGLTIYDMAKAVDREMRIEAIRLVEKHGGQSGNIVLE